MRGPVAPKDPVKKRPFFYILQDQDIFAAPTKEGKGVQFIYQNDGRMITSAKINGNLTDDAMLQLLKTTEGFRKLVAAIGVSVTEETGKEYVNFVYQMYGKTDPYQSGTSIERKILANGAEEIIELSEIAWSEDDDEPGQIRFEFEKSEIQASANVRFYVKEGFQVPDVIEKEKVETDTPDYQAMIARSLMQPGNPARIKKAINKAKKGEDVTIAYIGGSITQGAGAVPIHKMCYAYRSYQDFCNTYATKENVHFIKAGVGGTPSELGMIRFERDVLRDGSVTPDIVVVEFAVNDEGDETKGRCYDSLVRKILSLPNEPAVVLLFAVFADDFNLQDRLEVVGKTYDLPMVSIKNAVTEQFTLTKENGRVVSKNRFFYDRYHPSNTGHMIMKDCLNYLWQQAEKAPAQEDTTKALLQKKTAIGKEFENVQLFDRKAGCEAVKNVYAGDFFHVDSVLQCVEMDDRLEQIPQFPENWHYDGTGENRPFCMDVLCKSLVIVHKDSNDIHSGKIDCFVDGKKVKTIDPLEIGWTHCGPVILFEEEEAALHHIEICMAQGDEKKKSTILGFGIVR